MLEVNQPRPPTGEGRLSALGTVDSGVENPEYLTRQLITYIGNKRALLGHIAGAVERVKERLGKRKLRVFDAYSAGRESCPGSSRRTPSWSSATTWVVEHPARDTFTFVEAHV